MIKKQELINQLRIQLIKHEGLRLKAYTDTVGKLTVGVGRNLSDKGISESEAMTLLSNDIEDWVLPSLLKIFNDFDNFSISRQLGLSDMMFNLGASRFKKFKKAIEAIKQGDWFKASNEILNSQWAQQVGQRAKDIAKQLEEEE